MRALILANGDPPSSDLLERLISESDLFIVTDGAANRLVETGPTPHVVLGDFDSLDSFARNALPDSCFSHADDQEASDLDKAIAFAIERGAREVTITGTAGNRIDHSLTAISLLLKFADHAEVRLVEESGELIVLKDEVSVSGSTDDTVSIVVFETVHGVTTEGLLWPLIDATLTPGSRGVSNRMTEPAATIRITHGRAIVCHLRTHDGR